MVFIDYLRASLSVKEPNRWGRW